MGAFLVLLAKDLRRSWRNPWPWLLNLLIPLAMTGLVGTIFGGNFDGASLPRIRIAVVNEDRSLSSEFLITAVRRWKEGKILDVVPMSRADAESALSRNKLSAIVLIPENFMHHYFVGRDTAVLELIKNPAESIGPTVVEELTNVLVSMLNVVSRNLQSEIYQLHRVLEGNGMPSFDGDATRSKFELLGRYLNPMRITVDTAEEANDSAGTAPRRSHATQSISAIILIGMTAMFLLFLGNNAMGDLHTEFRLGTFRRFQSLHDSAAIFIAAKVIFTVITLLLACTLMLGGGGMLFGLTWREPLAIAALVIAYAWFVAALVALLVSLAPDARRASVLNVMAGMALGMIGGCMVPPEGMPPFIRNTILPYVPSNWFASAMRSLQNGALDVPWMLITAKLLVVGLVFIAATAVVLHRRLGQRLPS